MKTPTLVLSALCSLFHPLAATPDHAVSVTERVLGSNPIGFAVLRTETDNLASYYSSRVTTWLDVGTSGAFNFHGFRRYVVESNRSRCFALLNLSSIGLAANTFELSNLDYCDVDLAAMIVERNRDVILGIKARIDSSTTRGTGIAMRRRTCCWRACRRRWCFPYTRW